MDSAAAGGIINRRGVGKVRHLSCRSLWLQERMADGSMVVSPVSGLKNPADIRTKRLNSNRMKALMFLLGMFDHSNNCQVGEAEARSVMQQQELKRAMHSVRQMVKCDQGALQATGAHDYERLGLGTWTRRSSAGDFLCWRQMVVSSDVYLHCNFCWWMVSLPVVPHEAVAEVSRIGNL